MDDMALLREYAARNSEAAFAELVTRRIGFVYSAALRQAREPLLAGEITQAVFILLAQKAGKISGGAWLRRPRRNEDRRRGVAATNLVGWLFKAARFTALAQIRDRAKRSLRAAALEKELQMQTEFQSAGAGEIWNQMSPLLDEALAALGERDRQAVLLRFFENKSLAEVGSSLGIGEDTARKRVSRALEKLHRYFNRRGVSSTTAIIAGEISANSVQAAPVALAKSVTAIATAKGVAASTSTLTLIKGALKLMAWAKAKSAIVTGAAVILSVGTFTAVEKEVHLSSAEHGKLILNKVIAANRYWLNAPPDTVANYSYVFYLSGAKAPGSVQQTPVHVTNPRNALAAERQGITYSSLLQRLASNPEQVRVQSINETNGTITLALKFLPVPGARTSQVIGGKKYSVPPLEIACGNGLRGPFYGYFHTGGTNAELVIDAEKMVPLSSTVECPFGAVEEESFSDYSEVNPGSYVPLSVTVKETIPAFPPDLRNVVFAWKFKLHEGLWLFDESQYRGRKVAWTDQVAVNQSVGNQAR